MSKGIIKSGDKCIACEKSQIKYKSKRMCVSCYLKDRYKKNRKVREKQKKRGREYYWENREKQKKRSGEYYWENKEKSKEISREYYKKNRLKSLMASKKWRTENPKKQKEYQGRYKERVRIWVKNKRINDVQYKLRGNVSRVINFRLKKCSSSKKGKSTFTFLLYTVEELKQHLEKQFEPWMNWDNWGNGEGKWNIDHKIPDSSFNYKNVDDEGFQKCWALENLQPMDAIENMKKGNKIIY